MKVLPQSQQPTSSSSSFGRQNVVKGNFNFIFVTAQTHGFQKTVMFSRESLCPSFALTISMSLHILQLPDALYIRTCCWKADPACWLMLTKQPCQVSHKLVGGRTRYITPDHGPSANPSWASWKEDAIFPDPGLNITEMLGMVTHQEGK